MLVKDLQAVTDIWRLAADDPGTKLIALTLNPLSASFAGTHCNAVAGDYDSADGSILVDAGRLRGLLGLFDPEQECRADLRENELTLATRGRATVLRVAVDETRREVDMKAPDMQEIPTDEFLRALTFLQECVATGAGRPILTGVKIAHDNRGALLLAATDAEAHTGVARVKAKAPKKPIGGQLVVPTKEIREFLALAAGQGHETVKAELSPSRVTLAAGDMLMSVWSLASADMYPNLSVLRSVAKYPHKIKIEPEALAQVIKASILLDADRIVRLVLRRGKAALVVRGQQIGSFRSRLPGGADADSEDAELLFDAHWLTPIEHLGASATLHYVDGRTSVLFVGENGYRLWMALVIQG